MVTTTTTTPTPQFEEELVDSNLSSSCHSGQVHVRGKIRRVWRPRYFNLLDNGQLQYYDDSSTTTDPTTTTNTNITIDPNTTTTTTTTTRLHVNNDHHHRQVQQNSINNDTTNLNNTANKQQIQILQFVLKCTLIIHPNTIRIIDSSSLRDMHIGLPRGTYGFIFRAHRIVILSTTNNSSSRTTNNPTTTIPVGISSNSNSNPNTNINNTNDDNTNDILDNDFVYTDDNDHHDNDHDDFGTTTTTGSNIYSSDIIIPTNSDDRLTILQSKQQQNYYYGFNSVSTNVCRPSSSTTTGTNNGTTVVGSSTGNGSVVDGTTNTNTTNNNNLYQQVSEPRDYLCAVSSLEEAQMWIIALKWAASPTKTTTTTTTKLTRYEQENQQNQQQVQVQQPLQVQQKVQQQQVQQQQSIPTTTTNLSESMVVVKATEVPVDNIGTSIGDESASSINNESNWWGTSSSSTTPATTAPQTTIVPSVYTSNTTSSILVSTSTGNTSYPTSVVSTTMNTSTVPSRTAVQVPVVSTTAPTSPMETTGTTTSTTGCSSNNAVIVTAMNPHHTLLPYRKKKKKNSTSSSTGTSTNQIENSAFTTIQHPRNSVSSYDWNHNNTTITNASTISSLNLDRSRSRLCIVSKVVKYRTVRINNTSTSTNNDNYNTTNYTFDTNTNTNSSSWHFEIAYEIHCLLVRQQPFKDNNHNYNTNKTASTSTGTTTTITTKVAAVAETWSLLRTANDLEILIQNLCKELGPSLLDRAQLGLMKQLPRWKTHHHQQQQHHQQQYQLSPTELSNSISVVDSIVRSLVMDTDMINSNAMHVFLGINKTGTDSSLGSSTCTGNERTNNHTDNESMLFKVRNILLQLLIPKSISIGMNSLWNVHDPMSIFHYACEDIIHPTTSIDTYVQDWLVTQAKIASYETVDVSTYCIQRPIWIITGISLTSLAIIPVANCIGSTLSRCCYYWLYSSSIVAGAAVAVQVPIIPMRIDILVITWIGAAYMGNKFLGNNGNGSSGGDGNNNIGTSNNRRGNGGRDGSHDSSNTGNNVHNSIFTTATTNTSNVFHKVYARSSTSTNNPVIARNSQSHTKISSQVNTSCVVPRLSNTQLSSSSSSNKRGNVASHKMTSSYLVSNEFVPDITISPRVKATTTTSTTTTTKEGKAANVVGSGFEYVVNEADVISFHTESDRSAADDDDGVHFHDITNEACNDADNDAGSSSSSEVEGSEIDVNTNNDPLSHSIVIPDNIQCATDNVDNNNTNAWSTLPQYDFDNNERQTTRWSQPIHVNNDPNNNNNNHHSCKNTVTFYVRGISYLRDRIKVPSGPPALQCRGIDMWLSDNPERNIARHPAMLGGKLHDKDTFLVNFLLPFGNFVTYFTVPPLAEFPNDTVRSVWTKFLQGDQQYRDARLKLLPVVVEGPWIVKTAVGPGKSPALLGKVIPLQYFFTYPNTTTNTKGIYEVDVIITASTIAKGILSVVKGHTKSVSLAFAFIIEAPDQDELPETVLCSCQIHSIHIEDCPTLPILNLDDTDDTDDDDDE